MRLLWEEGPGPGPASDKVFYPCTRQGDHPCIMQMLFCLGI